MTAAYRLKGIGWFGASTAIVLAFYLVSLQVASERKKLEHLDSDIALTKREIRALETEFDTRSNLAQLERWNGDTLALSAPVPGQFLHNAAELASADVIRGSGAPTIRTAALIVPSFVAPAALPADVVAPPAVARIAAPSPAARASMVVVAGVRAVVKAARPLQSPARVLMAQVAARLPLLRSPTSRVALSRASYEPDAEPGGRLLGIGRARPQVALLDRKLLSDSTLRDLVGGARAEGGKLR